MVKIKHLICPAVKGDKCKHMLQPPTLCSTWEFGVTFRYINPKISFFPAIGTANRHSTSAAFTLSPHYNRFTTLQVWPVCRQSRCLQIGILLQGICGRKLAEDGRMSFRPVPNICKRLLGSADMLTYNSSCHETVFMLQTVMRQVGSLGCDRVHSLPGWPQMLSQNGIFCL